MKLISFLGTGSYEETCYDWPNSGAHGCTSRYAPAAICALLPVETLTLFCTPEAMDAHLETLRRELVPRVTLVPVEIPGGKSENELWQIFNLITKQVTPGESIALDVTHGLRSLPVIALLTAEFLRTARQVKVERLLYGAWEARDRTVSPTCTPIFDLTSMLLLLEWADAANRFTQHGEAQGLAALLSEAKPPHPVQQASRERRDIARNMGSASGQLRTLAESISLVRTYGVLQQADKLERILGTLDISSEAAASPFQQVLGSVQDYSKRLAMADPESSPGDNLEHQRVLILWYAEHSQYVQAATLGREWLVSWLLVRRGYSDLRDEATRRLMEDELNQVAHLRRCKKVVMQGIPADLDLPGWWQLIALDTRNDIDHAGMRKQETPADKLIDRIKQFAAEIRNWPLPTP